MASPAAATLAALLAACAVWLLLSGPDRHHGRRPRELGPGRDSPGATARLPAARATSWEPAAGRLALSRVAAVAAVGAATWAFLPGSWGALAAAAAMGLAWWRSRSWEPASARRRRARLDAELPWVVDLLGAALRVGLGPVEALGRVADASHPLVRTELLVPLARLRLGADPASVWRELAGHPQLGRLGVTLRRATESGAPVVDALSRLAEDLRADRRARVEVRVRRIEVRAAVPLGLCLLPAFVLLAVVPLVAGSASQLLTP